MAQNSLRAGIYGSVLRSLILLWPHPDRTSGPSVDQLEDTLLIPHLSLKGDLGDPRVLESLPLP